MRGVATLIPIFPSGSPVGWSHKLGARRTNGLGGAVSLHETASQKGVIALLIPMAADVGSHSKECRRRPEGRRPRRRRESFQWWQGGFGTRSTSYIRMRSVRVRLIYTYIHLL